MSPESLNHQENEIQPTKVVDIDIDAYESNYAQNINNVKSLETREEWKELALKLLNDSGDTEISYDDISHTSLWERIKSLFGGEEFEEEDVQVLKDYIELEANGFQIGDTINFKKQEVDLPSNENESDNDTGEYEYKYLSWDSFPASEEIDETITWVPAYSGEIEDIIINKNGDVQLKVLRWTSWWNINHINTGNGTLRRQEIQSYYSFLNPKNSNIKKIEK